MDLSCFKAYDLRGRVPDQLNPVLAEKIGRAYVEITGARKVIVGYDIRLSSPDIAEALSSGLMAAGADVFDIGLCGTEQVYFATSHYQMDGGIMVTASHNPKDHNGMKMVGPESRPISSDNGLNDIRDRVLEPFADAPEQGRYEPLEVMSAYVDHLLGYIDAAALSPMTIVCNAGNGGAGLVIDELEQHLPFEFVKVHHQPDGHFPNGVPNPILPENRAATADAVIEQGAAMGIAWDGDYDRCFFFDENGRFIEGYYIVGLLAEAFLERSPGDKVVHDPRLVWNTVEIAERRKGAAVRSATGHALMKETMRRVDAIYGGEMSAHHYFRDFAYCDSGMIPWLLVAEIMSRTGKSLSALVDARMALFPASGEINRQVDDANEVLERVENLYADDAVAVDHVDGVSMAFTDWRFNLRASNTEPLVRLNVETRNDPELMRRRTEELLKAVGGKPG